MNKNKELENENKRLLKEIDKLRKYINRLENPICEDCGKVFHPQNYKCSKCLIDHLDSI